MLLRFGRAAHFSTRRQKTRRVYLLVLYRTTWAIAVIPSRFLYIAIDECTMPVSHVAGCLPSESCSIVIL